MDPASAWGSSDGWPHLATAHFPRETPAIIHPEDPSSLDTDCASIPPLFSTETAFRANTTYPSQPLSPPESNFPSSTSTGHALATSYFDLDAFANTPDSGVWKQPTGAGKVVEQSWNRPERSPKDCGHCQSHTDTDGGREQLYEYTLNPSGTADQTCPPWQSVPSTPNFNAPSRSVASKPFVVPMKPPLTRTISQTRIPHSAVEKKYRSNLNTKLLELRQCLPALKAKPDVKEEYGTSRSIKGRHSKDIKLQKGLILTTAADYIRTLEARNLELEARNERLELRLEAFQGIALNNEEEACDMDAPYIKCEVDDF